MLARTASVALFAVVLASNVAAQPIPPATEPVAPRLVYLGAPRPDPNVAEVGKCVWSKLDSATLERLTTQEPPNFVVYGLGSVGGAATPLKLEADLAVADALRQCDERLYAHRNYSLLSVAATAWQETALARLVRSPESRRRPIDRPAMAAAWGQAPADVKTLFAAWLERVIDGKPGGLAPPDLSAVYELLRLKRPESRSGLGPLSAEQSDVRQYIIGVELERTIRERMTGSARFALRDPAPNEWVLDTDMGEEIERYYPARARDEEISGQARIQCAVTADGRFTDCGVVSESPAGMGFGEASVRALSRRTRIRMLDPTSPQAGQKFQVTLAWRLG